MFAQGPDGCRGPCKATYRGTITLYDHGYNKTSPKRLYGRFALTVR
jgi:hypothetical protein